MRRSFTGLTFLVIIPILAIGCSQYEDESARVPDRGSALQALIDSMAIPVMIGNCVTYDVTLDLMDAGADAVLVGVGPGAACTTRGVLGIGVPQVTATVDAAAARDLKAADSLALGPPALPPGV